jgi:predicted nuclease with TOPRIM domain
LKAQETQASKDKKQKTEFKAKQLESKSANGAELEETTSEKASDKKYRADLKVTCEKKATDMASRTKLRKEELEAIAKATEIIAGTVAGKADKHLPSLLQIRSKAAVLSFLRSEAQNLSPSREQAARFLQQGATSLGSRVLAAAAVRVRADPIVKVKEMIQNLITKLNEQNDKAAEKKAECDLQLTENKATREDKTDSVDTLKSEIDQLSAAITKLGEESVTLTKEISELDDAIKSATDLRIKEKEKNTATIKDAKEAQAAVAQALSVLNEFYEKAGEATALMQQSTSSHTRQPEIFDEAYNGMGGESGGVVGMLQVIESDFARLEAETTAEETKAKKEFDDFMEDSKVDKATKATAIEHKNRKKQTKSQDLTTAKADLLGTQKELDAAMATFQKLSATCLDTGASFKERQAQRAQEIKDLQEALEMLQSGNR